MVLSGALEGYEEVMTYVGVFAAIFLLRVLYLALLRLEILVAVWTVANTQKNVRRRSRRVAQLTELCLTTGQTCAMMSAPVLSEEGAQNNTHFEEVQDLLLYALQKAGKSCNWEILGIVHSQKSSSVRLGQLHSLRITLDWQRGICGACRNRLRNASSFSCALQDSRDETRAKPSEIKADNLSSQGRHFE